MLRSAALFHARGNVYYNRCDRSRNDLQSSYRDHNEAVSRASRSAGPHSRVARLCKYALARSLAALKKFDEAW
jgi:hypothetical protein